MIHEIKRTDGVSNADDTNFIYVVSREMHYVDMLIFSSGGGGGGGGGVGVRIA